MERFKEKLAESVARALGVKKDDVLPLVGAPKDPKLGDLAVPCFKLAQLLGRPKEAPKVAAEAVAKVEKGGLIADASAVGPFANFRLSPAGMAKDVLTDVMAEGWVGGSTEGQGKTIVLDYSSPNIAKPFHLGHLRSTVIGHSIRRLYESLGYRIWGVNHLGDWGTQFGFMLAAWQRWKDEAQQKITAGAGEIDVFVELYVRINKLAKSDEKVRDEARAWFKKLEDGDPEARELWRYFVERSKEAFEKIYSLLGIQHESDAGEAFYNDKMQPVIDRLRAAGLLVKGEKQEKAEEDDLGEAKAAEARPEGVDLGDPTKGGFGFAMVLKSDGGTTYITRDLAAVLYRESTYHPEKIVYVVGAPQILHFRQLKAILEKLAPDVEKKVVHVPFGQYLKMSTRRGTSVLLGSVLHGGAVAAQQAAEAAKEKADLTPGELAQNAKKIGVGAVRFFDLKHARAKDIDLTKLAYACDEHGEVIDLDAAGNCALCHKAVCEVVAPCPDHPEGLQVVERSCATCKAVLPAGSTECAAHEDAPVTSAFKCMTCEQRLEQKRVVDLDRLLSPKGDTGPYVLYGYARASGILRKVEAETGTRPSLEVDWALLAEPEVTAVVKLLAEFPDKVRLALSDHEPSFIARYALDLAGAANHFINVHRVKDAEPATRAARTLLVAAFRKVIGQSLDLLGIEPLEKM